LTSASYRRKRDRLIIKRKDVFWLILLRLIIVTTLVVAVVIIQYSTSAFLPTLFYYLILGAYVLSLVYIFFYYWGKFPTFQVYLQIFFDLLLITAFVYFSGGLRGSFYFLYIFEIIAASIVLSKRAAYLTAALSGVFFGFLVNGMHMGFLTYLGADQPAELSPGLVINSIFISWSVFFLVAFLVNYLTGSLRRTAEKLRLAQKELDIKKRLALAGEFSAHMAHEIRNPLAVISGSVQVLRESLVLEDDHKELMDNIVRQSERVSQSIEQYLSLVSPDKRTFADLNLASVVDDVLLLLEDSGELNEKFEVAGNYKDFDAGYFGNINQFKQLFWNLIRISVKSSPESGVLSIDFDRDRKEGFLLRILYRRNDKEKAKEYISGDSPPCFDSEAEIAMAVVRRIVDDYNGRIHVRSSTEGGTEITISLPKQQKSAENRMRI
jgi:signal transduction histidine kinase